MARLFLPAGTNYVQNPRFVDSALDGSADGWTFSHSTTNAPTYSVGAATGGLYYQRVQYTGVVGDDGSKSITISSPYSSSGAFAAGDAITASAYASGSLSGVSLALFTITRTAADAIVDTTPSAAITPSGTGARFSTTLASASATTSKAHIRFSFTGISEGDTIDVYLWGAMQEKAPVLTPYFDGSTVDSLNASTYAWTGTANASTSTRSASALAHTLADNAYNSGTVAARFSPLFANGVTWATSPYLAQISAGDGAPYAVSIAMGSTTLSLACRSSAGTTNCSSTGRTWSIGSTHSAVLRWTQGITGTMDNMFDGVAAVQATQDRTLDTSTTLQTGSYLGGIAQSYCYVGPVILSAVRKPDAWTTAVDAYLRGTSIDIDYIKKNFMAPGDALFTGRQIDGSNIYVKGS